MLKKVRTQKDHWFFGPILACKKVYFQVIWASVLINLFALASSLYIMTVYDRVVPNNAIESLWALSLHDCCCHSVRPCDENSSGDFR
jgi:ATP-binding cassette subfamily C protein LapB